MSIPSGVTTVGTSAIGSCFLLQSANIPLSVTNFGNNMFANCTSLQSVSIQSGATSIPGYCFQYCYSLQSVSIPSSVTTIGASAFSNCYGVYEYHLERTNPPTLLNTNAFTGIVAGTVIYVPPGCLEAYQTATNWSTYASYMQEEMLA